MRISPKLLDTTSRYAHIDALRCVAVLLVVVAHAGLGHVVPGGGGVTIFFAISGFIITTVLLKERTRTGSFHIGIFYAKRLLKLAPPLIVVTLIPTIIYSRFSEVDWSRVASQMFFYFNWNHGQDLDGIFPGSGVVWSLSIEEQFYIAVAATWLLIAARSGARWMLAAVAATAVLTSTALRLVIASRQGDFSDAIYYGSETRLDAIAWGVLAALLMDCWADGKCVAARNKIAKSYAPVLAILFYLFSLIFRDEWFRDTFRYSVQSLSTCVVLLFGFAGSGWMQKILSWFSRISLVKLVGLASYSIYLSHLSLITFLRPHLDDLEPVLQILINVTASIIIGLLLYLVVEKPFESVRRGLGEGDELPKLKVANEEDAGTSNGQIAHTVPRSSERNV